MGKYDLLVHYPFMSILVINDADRTEERPTELLEIYWQRIVWILKDWLKTTYDHNGQS